MSARRYFVEPRVADTPRNLVVDVAVHLQKRLRAGPVIIVSDRPIIFLSLLRKSWMKQARRLQCARASTLDRDKIAACTEELSLMYTARFCATRMQEMVNVRIISPEDLEIPPENYGTFYICTSVEPALLEQMLDLLASDGVVVDYVKSLSETSAT